MEQLLYNYYKNDVNIPEICLFLLYCLIFAVSWLKKGCHVPSCNQIPAIWKSSTCGPGKLHILWAAQMCSGFWFYLKLALGRGKGLAELYWQQALS